DPMIPLKESSPYATIRAATYAWSMLRAGITSCREAGAADMIGIAVQQAVDAGIVAGPRIIACGQIIAMDGGGKWGARLRPEIDAHQLEAGVTGADQIRRAVRLQLRRGATATKFFATGLLGSEWGGHDEQLTVDEMRAG